MDPNLRISQESIEMDDIIAQINGQPAPERHPSQTENVHEIASPQENRRDDTFDHYDDVNVYSQRASVETFTREFPTNEVGQSNLDSSKHAVTPEVSKHLFTQKNEGYHHPQLIDEDIETFKTKLEGTLLDFKNEALKDFMNIKRNVLQEQMHTIENERSKYNALLSSKQNEIETLKENLASSNKLNEDLRVRSEILALMAGKNRQMMRLRVTQYKAFKALKTYVGFKKHSKNILEAKDRENKLKDKRKIFQAWQKRWKLWKTQKSKDDFDAKYISSNNILG